MAKFKTRHRHTDNEAAGPIEETPDQNESGNEEALRVEEKLSKYEADTRVFSKNKEIVVDAYKLNVGLVEKRVGMAFHPDENPDDFKGFEHTHVFRTFDSDGKKHEFCTPLAGHFHRVTLAPPSKPGAAPRVVSVSGPLRMVSVRERGKYVKKAVPLNDYDDHTHSAEYISSHKAQVRVKNTAAAQFIAQDSMKYSTPSGVGEAAGGREDSI